MECQYAIYGHVTTFRPVPTRVNPVRPHVVLKQKKSWRQSWIWNCYRSKARLLNLICRRPRQNLQMGKHPPPPAPSRRALSRPKPLERINSTFRFFNTSLTATLQRSKVCLLFHRGQFNGKLSWVHTIKGQCVFQKREPWLSTQYYFIKKYIFWHFKINGRGRKIPGVAAHKYGFGWAKLTWLSVRSKRAIFLIYSMGSGDQSP